MRNFATVISRRYAMTAVARWMWKIVGWSPCGRRFVLLVLLCNHEMADENESGFPC